MEKNMRKEQLSCRNSSIKSLRSRMAERSDQLKKTNRIRQRVNVGHTPEVPQTTFDAADELDKLHRKWKKQQFHFSIQDDSFEQRDDDEFSSKSDSTGLREQASYTSNNKLCAKALENRTVKSSKVELSPSSRSLASRTQKANTIFTKRIKGSLGSNLWKEKQLDEHLERMIAKLQKQNMVREDGNASKSEMKKQEKRKKLLSILNEIKQKMNHTNTPILNATLSGSMSKKDQSAWKNCSGKASFSKRVRFNLSNEKNIEQDKHTFKSKLQSQRCCSPVRKSSQGSSPNKHGYHFQTEEDTSIPKETIIQMQKLLSSHRQIEQSPKLLRQIKNRRLRKTSVLDAIPENDSLSFDKSYSTYQDSELSSLNNTRTDEKVCHNQKQRASLTGGILSRAINFLCCGKMSD